MIYVYEGVPLLGGPVWAMPVGAFGPFADWTEAEMWANRRKTMLDRKR